MQPLNERTEITEYQQLLSDILNDLSHRQDITVEQEWRGTLNVVLRPEVHEEEMGLIAGKGGTCLKAIQNLFLWVARSHRLKRIDICVGVVGQKTENFDQRKTWDTDKASNFAHRLITAGGHELFHSRIERLNNCYHLIVSPEIEEPLFSIIHTILENYGLIHSERFGLSHES